MLQYDKLLKPFILSFKMAEKCELCNEKIEETFLGKLNGTTIRVEKNTRTGFVYVCNGCQREHRDELIKNVNKT